jgi:hypothetical protein
MATGLESSSPDNNLQQSGSGVLQWLSIYGVWVNCWPTSTTDVDAPAIGGWYVENCIWIDEL